MIRFGPPMAWCTGADQAADATGLRQRTDELMVRIQVLSGQEYSDTDARAPQDDR